DPVRGIPYPLRMEPATTPSTSSEPAANSFAARARAPERAAAGGLPRTFWILCAGIFVNRAGAFVVPFLSVYLTQARGYPAATAGFVAALYGAAARSASLIGGYLADHVGRRRTMLLALVLGGTGMIALGF